MNIYDININYELEKLIRKYNLDKHYPAYRMSRKACNFINNWVKNLSGNNKTYLFISMDEYALDLIRRWAETNNIDTLLIDSVNELEKFSGKLANADIMYIVSYSQGIEILHWLWKYGYQAWSVYDLLENENIYLQMEFYRFFVPIKLNHELDLDKINVKSNDGVSGALYEYYYQKQRLNHCVCDVDKRRILEKMFFLSVYMKNFIEAKRLLELIHDHNEMIKNFWIELQELLDQIKRALSERKERNIIVYWLDALSYEEAKKMKYLQSRRDHSLYFHNAYTVTPYTIPTARAMFCGIKQVDDLGYREIELLNEDNSLLIKDMTEQGYCLNGIGWGWYRFLDSQYCHCAESYMVDSCSQVFWNLIAQILSHKRRTVYIVHALTELHPPALSVRREIFEKKYTLMSMEAQMEELNDQLQFYDQLLGEYPCRIYMSDHGSYKDFRELFHIHFQVYCKEWGERDTYKLFCPLDFQKILCLLMKGESVNEASWNREYIPIQDVDFYNKEILKNLIKERKISFNRLAYKGVITNEYVYLHYRGGIESYNRWSDNFIHINLDNLNYNNSFLLELRQKAGEFPKELDKDPKFKYSVYTYKISNNIKQTIREITEILNEKLSIYEDNSVAIRMGGEHSFALYDILTNTNKKKVGVIIDKNSKCVCAKIGVPIIKPGEFLGNRVQTILLSSFCYLNELREETKNIYKDKEIIDVYYLWSQYGYHFTSEFWNGAESDYDVEFPEN